MPASTSTTSQRVPRHPEYYIHGGDVVFSVEDTLFRVHRFFFLRDSSWFREKIPSPLSPGSETLKGTSDNLPLVLEDATKTDFERLLWVFYNPKYSLYDATIEEWASILKLADKWNIIEVKELAIRGLESIQVPALQKIVLYQTYKVDRKYLQAAYTALTVRDEPITIAEGRELGLETALQLARAREFARAPVFGGRRAANPRSPVTLVGDELHTLINDVFELPSPGATSEQTANTSQAPTGGGSGSTQTNPAQPAAQGTGGPANGSANGTTNGSQNGHVNGTTPNHGQSNGSSGRNSGRGPR